MAVEVILRDDVPNLGKIGDVVRVKPGYARNYLLPRGLAIEASQLPQKVPDEGADAEVVQLSGVYADPHAT